MLKISTFYQINRNTLAILPAMTVDYQAIVRETKRELLVQQTPLTIIKTNCIAGAASYQGRQKAASKLIGSTRKVPILIYERAQIYAFPTQSPSNFSCSWVFAKHIHKIIEHPQARSKQTQSTIIFRNGTTIDFEESAYQLQNQLTRTLKLHYAIKDANLQPV
ncbi:MULTISPECIES: competence protein ComK [Paraliobacillus]|uniref:competence protein ComK n=1 Tax=Paraliobacillus TaxID=200903 RepID=UPI000DD476D0|nr:MULTISPECIES: competence protein ComK [Paraliobacillus]